MSKGQLHDRIDQYLMDELSQEERIRLEAEMAADPSIREQVEVRRLALMGIREFMASDMRSKFRQWDEELDADQSSLLHQTPLRFKLLTWFVAVLLLLLTTLTVLHLQQMKMVRKMEELKNQEIARRDTLLMDLQSEIRQKKSELEDIQAALAEKQDSLNTLNIDSLRENLQQLEQKLRELQQYLPLKNQQIALLMAPLPATTLTRTRSLNDDLAPVLADALDAFDASRFDDAAELLQAIPPSDSLLQRGAAQLLPYALFYNGQFEAAARAFTQLKAIDKYEAKKADGFILLCYVALGKYSDAKQLLTAILKDPDHPFHEQAKKLKTTLVPEFF